MKKSLLISLIFCLIMISGCSDIQEENAAAPNVMINNKFYHTTGIVAEDEGFEVSGKIKSSVDGTKIPYKNNQSNFGVGMEYAIISDDVVYVNADGKWIRFERYEC